MSKIRRIFPASNTCKGLYHLHDNIISEDRNRLYILKGMPGGGKSSLMKRIGERALREGLSLEYHHCPSDPGSIDAVVINELNIAIVDGTPPHSMDPIYPGLGDKIINLAAYIDEEKMSGYRDDIAKAKINNRQAYRRTFNYFKSAKFLYDEIESNNSENQDFKKVNILSEKLLNEIFSYEVIGKGKYRYNFKNRHLFSNAYTPKGYFDYTEGIIRDVGNKYYLKGDIGSGKSTLMKRIIDRSNMKGYHLEIYYNPFNPEKIESLLIYELDLIISANKKIKNYDYKSIDLDQYLDKSKFNKEDYEIFYQLIKKGTEALKTAKNNHFIQEKIYNNSIDFTGIDRERERIWDEIKKYI